MRHIYGLAGFIAAFFFLAVTVVFAQDVTHPAPGAPLRAEFWISHGRSLWAKPTAR